MERAPIQVEALTKRFGARTAVEGLSFTVERGEVFGLLGPNGAGKTTTLRMLTGLVRPTSGTARVCGLDVATHGEAVRRKVGLSTEQPGLYERLSARENLRFYLKLNELDEREGLAWADSWLERFGLSGRDREPVGGFSKGMRQKLSLVRALVHRPEVLFLDEPTSGLDPEAARSVRDAISELATAGQTVVLCSHNLPEVERLCRNVAVVRTRLLAATSLSALRRRGRVLRILLSGAAEPWVEPMRKLPFGPVARAVDHTLEVEIEDEAQAPEVISALVLAGARIHEVARAERPLEEAYLALLHGAETGASKSRVEPTIEAPFVGSPRNLIK